MIHWRIQKRLGTTSARSTVDEELGQILSFQFSHSSHVQLFAIAWTAARQASLSITNSRSLLKLKSIILVKPSNHLILCRPLLLLASIFLSIRVFSDELVLHIRWPKYWSFSFSISPSNEYSGLISFRMDWLDLLAVQGTLKSLLQHHNSKASILQRSAFFMVQLSHPYMWDVGRGGLTLSETAQLLFKVTVPTSNPTSRRQFQFPTLRLFSFSRFRVCALSLLFTWLMALSVSACDDWLSICKHGVRAC